MSLFRKHLSGSGRNRDWPDRLEGNKGDSFYQASEKCGLLVVICTSLSLLLTFYNFTYTPRKNLIARCPICDTIVAESGSMPSFDWPLLVYGDWIILLGALGEGTSSGQSHKPARPSKASRS